MDKKIIVANWKMYPIHKKDAIAIFNNIKNLVSKLQYINVILAPVAVHIDVLSSSYRGNKISFCAQNISEHIDVAHTGEVSAEQFADLKVKYTLIGSKDINDNDKTITKKTFLSVKNGMTPIIYIGEDKRDIPGRYLGDIKSQVLSSIKEVPTNKIGDVVFCYEPKWIHNSTEPLDDYEIHTMVLFIRKIISEEYNRSISRKIKIIYGGLVDSSNVKDILKIDKLDGVIVGSVTHKLDKFSELLKEANRL